MATNFQAAYTQLMRTIQRPLSETNVLAGAKDAINDSIRYLQRDHSFSYAEALNTITYPASSLYVNVGDVCGGLVRDFKSIQQLGSNGTYSGKPLKIMPYSVLQSKRNAFLRTHTEGFNYLDAQLSEFISIEEAYRTDLIVFISGANIGLYPMPTQDVSLLMNLTIWLPELRDDDDTNFFLDYAMDVVQMLALRKMSMYMRTSSLFPYAKDEVDMAIATLHTWDSQLRENSNNITQ